MAQDGCGSCLGKFWLWQGQRVPRGTTFRQHLSLRVYWTALRRIHDPSIMWRPARSIYLCSLMCEPFQVLPFKPFPRYSRRLAVSKQNQPEFSPSRKSRLEEVHPYPFSYSFSVLCYLSITLPINHNPHLHSNTPTPSPTPLRRDLPLGVGSILFLSPEKDSESVDRLQFQLTSSPSRFQGH